MSLAPGLYPGFRLRSSSSLSDRVKHASQRALFRAKYLLSRMTNIRKLQSSQHESGCEMCIGDSDELPVNSTLAEQVIADLDRREKLRRRKMGLDHRQHRLGVHDCVEYWRLEEMKLDLVEGLNDLECKLRMHDRRGCVDDSVRWWTVMQEQIAERKIFASQEFARLHKLRFCSSQPEISSASMATSLQRCKDFSWISSSSMYGKRQTPFEGPGTSFPVIPMPYIVTKAMEHSPIPMFWEGGSLERARQYDSGPERAPLVLTE